MTDHLRQLNALVAAIVPANPFYTRKLGGERMQFASLAEFSARVPFTTKPELADDQAAHPPFGTNLTFPLERYTHFYQTSGTSGRGLRWLDTNESWQWMLDCWAEVYRAAGVGPGDRVFFAFSFGPFLGFWTAFDSAARLGCLCIPAGGLSSTARLHAILDNGATVLCCTPTYAVRLGELAVTEGLSLAGSQVRVIIVAGEPGGSVPAVRERIERLWPNARAFDHHGMTEIGPATYEHTPGTLALIESGYFAEIINPASDGTGELVLTNLGRIGSPLLRYRTGDLVKPVRLPTGGLGFEGGIIGRADDMVIVRGINLYPSAVEKVMAGFAEIAEYRVHIRRDTTATDAHIEVEPHATCPDAAALVSRVEQTLRDAFILRIPVRAVGPGTLPRFEMKARRWVVQAAVL